MGFCLDATRKRLSAVIGIGAEVAYIVFNTVSYFFDILGLHPVETVDGAEHGLNKILVDEHIVDDIGKPFVQSKPAEMSQ